MEGITVRIHRLRANRIGLSGLFLGALIALAPLSSTARGNDAQWILVPGGVADASGTTAYVTGLSDTVEAVDMANGQMIWESKEAHRPLAVVGERVIAEGPREGERSNTMTIVMLDVASGNVSGRSESIVFPEWVAVEGGIGLKFFCVAAVEGSELVLFWNAERRLAGGTNLTPEAISAAYKVASGLARVDLTGGQATLEVDRVARAIKGPRSPKVADVASKRLSVVERGQAGPDGLQVFYRTLQASDRRTGRPIWEHEIASRVILPNIIPGATKTTGRTAPSRR